MASSLFTKIAIENSLKNGMSYEKYRTLVRKLLDTQASTGVKQSEGLYRFSILNNSRMNRLDKTITLSGETIKKLQNVTISQTWLVITEGWCGDAAQNIPVLAKMAAQNQHIKLKLVLRDENLELMDIFLTNGSRSVPKLIALDDDKNILFTWGPRPSIATKMADQYKELHGVLDAKIKEDLQRWYNKDRGVTIQNDIVALISH